MGEIASLAHSLAQRIDIRPQVGHWRWTEASPWPPLALITRTTFWTSDAYAEVRGRLARPAPTIKLLPGGQYGSCQLVGDAQPLAEPDDDMIQWEGAPEGERSVATEHAVCLSPPLRVLDNERMHPHVVDDGVGHQDVMHDVTLQGTSDVYTVAHSHALPQIHAQSTSLMHVISLQPGAAIPDDMRTLKFPLIVVESTVEVCYTLSLLLLWLSCQA